MSCFLAAFPRTALSAPESPLRRSPAFAADERVPARAWLVLLLGGLAGMLFYIDRQSLSVLKTTLKAELGWTDTQYGWLVSAFMLCYTACYLFSGRWIDRWGTRKTMPLFLGLMSLATLLCGFSRSLGEMAFFRALLGIAESGIVPAVLVAIIVWFPPTRRGTAGTIKEPINMAGSIVATPLAVALAQAWGWRGAFFLPGVIGFAVAFAWWWADRPRSAAPASSSAPERAPVSYGEILRRREIWGIIAARVVSDPMWFFLLYWEPGFLQEQVGFSFAQLGRVGWIPTAFAAACLVALGVLSDRAIVRFNWSPARSRRLALQAVAGFAPAVLALPFVHNQVLALVLLCLARVMMVVWLNFSNLLMADLVERPLLGTAVALMSAFGAATGLLCNAVVGPVVDAVGYRAIFIVGACLHPLAALILWRCYAPPRGCPEAARAN